MILCFSNYNIYILSVELDHFFHLFFYTVSNENPKPINGEACTTVTQDQVEPKKDNVTLTSERNNLPVKEEAIKTECKSDIINGEQQNNNVDDSKSAAAVHSKDSLTEVKKEKKPTFEDDDPFAALDWKDGIATLPGTR